jgi:hypothetical protein
MGCSLTGSL